MRLKLLFLLNSLLLLCGLHAKAQSMERQFRVFNASDGLADNSAQSIVCTKTGRMVVTTIGHINFYDGMTFSHIDPVKANNYPLPNYRGHYHPYFDRYHHLWLKNKRCVTCLDLTTERFVSNVDSVFKELGMNDKVLDMFTDDDGCVWMVHGNKIYSTELKKDFPVDTSMNLQDIIEYDNKELLQFYENGEVVSYNLKTGKQLYRIRAYDESKVRTYYRTSLVRRYDDMLYQIRDGEQESILLSFDVKKRQWETLMTCPYKLNNLVKHDSIIYMASEYGYWMYYLDSKKTNLVQELTLTDGHKLLTDVNTIEFDRQGGMWIGTESRGLLYAKPFTSPFKVYNWSDQQALDYYSMMEQRPHPPTEYQGESVNSVFRDSRGWTWVCTRTGLLLYETENGKPRVFTRTDGLLNDVIHAAIEDDNGNIWVSTSYGISQLVFKDRKFMVINSYNHTDNVPSESFGNGRVMKLDDGTIVMEALDHVVAFQPADFHPYAYNDFKFYPKLIDLMVNGNKVLAGTKLDGNLILERAISRTREVNVNYYHNSLLFLFSGLNYFRPFQTYFRYRIPELDEKWRVVSYFNSNGMVDEQGVLHLQLAGLQPGEYHIEVQVSMHPDVWIQEPLVWLLRVNEPWWRTSGVYVSLGVIILILLALNLLLFNRNVRLKMRRNAGERDVIRQLHHLISRCDSISGEKFSLEKDSQTDTGSAQVFSEQYMEYMQLMLKVIPYMKMHPSRLTIHQLCEVGGIKDVQFLKLVSQHMMKKPYELALRLRLQQAADLLLETDKPVEDVAEECGFASPNYFVAKFFRLYGLTPVEYRSSEN